MTANSAIIFSFKYRASIKPALPAKTDSATPAPDGKAIILPTDSRVRSPLKSKDKKTISSSISIYRAAISGVGNEVVLPQLVSQTDVPKPMRNPRNQ